MIIFKSKETNLLDCLNSPDEILMIYVKRVKHHCILLISSPGMHGEYCATSQTPVCKGLEKEGP